MKFARIVGPLLLCAGLGLAASAHAEGWYVVVFGGEASSEGLDQDELDAGLVDGGFDLQSSALDDSDTGFGATLGYQVNENFAAELSYVDLGDGVVQATNGQASPRQRDRRPGQLRRPGRSSRCSGSCRSASASRSYGRAGLALMDPTARPRSRSATWTDAHQRLDEPLERARRPGRPVRLQ